MTTCLVSFCAGRVAWGAIGVTFIFFPLIFFISLRNTADFSVFSVSSKCLNYGNTSRDYKIEIKKSTSRFPSSNSSCTKWDQARRHSSSGRLFFLLEKKITIVKTLLSKQPLKLFYVYFFLPISIEWVLLGNHRNVKCA